MLILSGRSRHFALQLQRLKASGFLVITIVITITIITCYYYYYYVIIIIIITFIITIIIIIIIIVIIILTLFLRKGFTKSYVIIDYSNPYLASSLHILTIGIRKIIQACISNSK